MDKTEGYALLHQELRATCKELFEAISMNLGSVVAESKPVDARQVASVIGFTGPHLRGALTLRAPLSFFAGTRPLTAHATRDFHDKVGDWAGEFTNQLLGRLKSNLLGHGIHLQLSTPAVITGEYMQESAAREGSLDLAFRWTTSVLHVRLDAHWVPGAELSEPLVSDVAEAGDAILF